jgi:hypothetical protein
MRCYGKRPRASYVLRTKGRITVCSDDVLTGGADEGGITGEVRRRRTGWEEAGASRGSKERMGEGAGGRCGFEVESAGAGAERGGNLQGDTGRVGRTTLKRRRSGRRGFEVDGGQEVE